jgi:hypothetical protein
MSIKSTNSSDSRSLCSFLSLNNELYSRNNIAPKTTICGRSITYVREEPDQFESYIPNHTRAKNLFDQHKKKIMYAAAVIAVEIMVLLGKLAHNA